jgi:hypothetical protein
MSPRPFDRFMVDIEVGRNLKLARLQPAERWAFIAGVLAVAAKAPMRGSMTVGLLPATPEDVARQADVAVAVAARTLDKIRELGMLERDDEGVDWVHDWEDWQREPSKASDADRARKYRARLRASRDASHGVTDASRDANVTGHDETRDASRTKREVEVEDPPYPPNGGVTVNTEQARPEVTYQRRRVPDATLALAADLVAEFGRQSGQRTTLYDGLGKPTEQFRLVIGAVMRFPDRLTADTGPAVIRSVLADPWWEGPPSIGVVFGPKVLERNLQRSASNGAKVGAQSYIDRLHAQARENGLS